MAKHFMKLQEKPFELIRCGRKIYELRLYDEKRRQIKAGDSIEFTCESSGEKLTVRVVGLLRFCSFDELYKSLPLADCGYADSEIPQASPKDMEKYYSPEKQAEYGVLAIRIERI